MMQPIPAIVEAEPVVVVIPPTTGTTNPTDQPNGNKGIKTKVKLYLAGPIAIAVASLVLLAVSAGTKGWLTHTIRSDLLPFPLIAKIGLFRTCHTDEVSGTGGLTCSGFGSPSDGDRPWCLDGDSSGLTVGGAFARFRVAQAFIVLATLSAAAATACLAALLHRSTPRVVAYIGAGVALSTAVFLATVYGLFFGTLNTCEGGYCGQLRGQLAHEGLTTFTEFSCGVDYSLWVSVAGGAGSLLVAVLAVFLGKSQAFELYDAPVKQVPAGDVTPPFVDVATSPIVVPATMDPRRTYAEVVRGASHRVVQFVGINRPPWRC